ncbi:hypothetical protein AMR42_18815 [Limnothrix sp. PR1529]|uniref:Uma2 family endonuclease n=1 Tax=Limnothrix sp. PR1529 TaxID=1704291 RepID=UPI00081E1FF0|nr:Uma2 family endonuclease [Limnothrix sp. PR1529]OCQ93009.1 hypothetical protein BCR12_17705 [Limnothrix sp. P13C2]PIB03587.1 hypothetical protein AMR42_18815 [Limnothrix sp. PR1529]
MIAIAPLAPTQLIGEKRVTLRGLTWQTYQQVLHALPFRRSARLTYDHGVLEITMPLEDHEFSIRLIERFIIIMIFEMGLKIKTMGSTRIEREELDRSSEPDCAYYIQNQARVAGRRVDFATDPPPDLVVEVDITHTDIDKNRLYAAMGVPELWRYNGRDWRIFILENGDYQESEFSPIFPWVQKAYLYQFLAEAQQDEIAAEQALRQLVRDHLAQ